MTTQRRVRGKGVHRAYTRTRNGRTEHVREYRIAKGRGHMVGRGPKQPPKPLLYAACTAAGAGALTAVLGGRPFVAAALVGVAVALGVTHLAWQSHKKRQAQRQARPKQSPAELQRKAADDSARLYVRQRAFKEGARRKTDTVLHGKEHAAAAAEARKTDLTHGEHPSVTRAKEIREMHDQKGLR